MRDIAEVVRDVFADCTVTLNPNGGPDTRSYRVSFDKINERLPGFSCSWDAERGVRELKAIFERVDLTRRTFAWRGYTRLKQIEYLLRSKQIDDDFFWIV